MAGRATWALIAVPALIVLVGALLERSGSFSAIREHVQGHSVPDVFVKSGRTGKELRVLEYRPLANFRLDVFSEALAPEDMPSSKAVTEIVSHSLLPTISIVADAKDLLHRDTGILANYNRRGRNWERPAYVSYFDDGELILGTGAGIRVHGGKSRRMHSKSFRIYFRDLYGSTVVSSTGIFAGEPVDLSTLVVHNDVRLKTTEKGAEQWHFVNPIAYEISELIGCIVPRTTPVAFYLNGESQGSYVLTEHLSADFIARLLGHDDFVFARMKLDEGAGASQVQHGDPELFEEYASWPKNAPAPLTMADAAAKVDLQNFTNWVISVLFAGVTDPYQGAAVRDLSEPGGKWFFVNWDMDHAFMDLYSQADAPWNIDLFTGRSGLLWVDIKPRAVLFSRLIKESPDYRLYFIRRLTESLNHVLTPDRTLPIVARYAELASRFGLKDTRGFDVMQQFMRERPDALRMQISKYLEAGSVHRLTIRNGSGRSVRVDGHEIAGFYSGAYFSQSPAVVEVADLDSAAPQSIVMNGEVISLEEMPIEIHLTEDVRIEIR